MDEIDINKDYQYTPEQIDEVLTKFEEQQIGAYYDAKATVNYYTLTGDKEEFQALLNMNMADVHHHVTHQELPVVFGLKMYIAIHCPLEDAGALLLDEQDGRLIDILKDRIEKRNMLEKGSSIIIL